MADRHPGITMHKLPVGGGFIGLLFALGCSIIFVLGFPTLWYFVALTFVLGVAIAIFLRVAGRYRSERNQPLSILRTEPTKQAAARPEPPSNLLHSAPLPAGA